MAASVLTERARVELLDPLACPTWDADIQGLPGVGFFHSQAWAGVLQATHQFTPCYFVARASGRLVGMLPMMEVDSWLTGRRGISLPFTDACAPLVENDAALRDLVEAAWVHGRTRGWKYCELRGGRDRLHAPAAISYHGHTLDLTIGASALLQATESAARRAIRKAERNEVQIEFTRDRAAVREFHDLLCQTRKRHGVPPQPFRFFDQIHRQILAKEHGVVVLARHAGRAVAGAIFFHAGARVLFKFGASDDSFQQFRPNNLLMWRAIEWHAKSGFETLDFGRTDLGHEGLRRFKLGWGARETLIEYVRHDFRRGEFVRQTGSSGALTTLLFRHLPTSVSRLIGSLLYRHAA